MDIEDLIKPEGDSDFQIGIGADLLLAIEGVEVRTASMFVGLKDREYLIVTPPTHYNSIKHKLFKGNHLIVRYLHKGTVYAFPTRIIDLIQQPTRLVLLEYPEIVQNRDLRTQKRACCFIPARLEGRKASREGVLTDISRQGCRCNALYRKGEKVLFQKEEPVRLVCQFPGVGEEQTIVGLIKNVQRNRQELTLGIHFAEVSETVNGHIARYILNVQDFC